MPGTYAPRRRGRPPIPERRDQVVRAAARLFQRRGYPMVAMKDVAASLSITASALYRHCDSKNDLLHAAITSGLDVVEEALREAGDSLEDALRALAEAAVAREDVWILVRRELRHLTPAQRKAIRQRLARILGTLRERLALRRPHLDADSLEFAARSALAALAVPSQFGYRFDPKILATTMGDVAIHVVNLDVGDDRLAPDVLPKKPFDGGLSRREELLGIAARLFAERGYQEVSLTDIGSAAGMAGPSLYHHFDRKIDVLVGVLRRAAEWIELDLHSALTAHDDPVRVLRQLVTDHVDLALTHWDLFRVYQNESIQLPPDEHSWVTRSHKAFMERWVELARAARPDYTETQARVHVFSALCVINDLAGSAHMRVHPAFRARLEHAAFGCIDVARDTARPKA
ncbi:TetR/AcrR family transcriptional regulator [Phytohabitans sp. ZYX-F-186]|uniref:TetR/AcrR family transcriptional regulator n=1 Tax=Phytohabitans maris TaxID=3071409 RepID=A0ABU0ZKA9_9ACTN|nr:TetR/AcrR family transcriptional regulator [Phytohabitans sp. ZYX-F-186]MDQ7907484.1 TetR/AcrR family transcriptional regulator [Phytohabitans sp. ZYX-F-186]